jgi:hypothetical protein
MGVKTFSTTLRIDTGILVACVRETFDIQDLYHNLTMPVQDRLRATHDTARGHLQYHSANHKGQRS